MNKDRVCNGARTCWDMLWMLQQASHVSLDFLPMQHLKVRQKLQTYILLGLSFLGIHVWFPKWPKTCQNLPKLYLWTTFPKFPFYIFWDGVCHHLSPSDTTIFNSCHRQFVPSKCRARAKKDKSQHWVARQFIDNPLKMRLRMTAHSGTSGYSSSGFSSTVICKAVGIEGWFSQS